MRRSVSCGFLAAGLTVAVVLVVAGRSTAHVSVGAPIAPPTATDDTATTTATTDATTTTTTTTSTITTTTTSATTTTTTTTTLVAPTSTATARATGATPAASVTASSSLVGAGGTITFAGSCPAADVGSLVVRITGTFTELVDTGITAATWTWSWTAPTDIALIGSFEFEFWCGDPNDATGLPAPSSQRVDMVASAPTPDTAADTTATTTNTAPPAGGAPTVGPVTVTLPRTR